MLTSFKLSSIQNSTITEYLNILLACQSMEHLDWNAVRPPALELRTAVYYATETAREATRRYLEGFTVVSIVL